MGKTEANLKASEDFIRQVLAKHFHQTVDGKDLRQAAEKLCDAVPSSRKEAA